MKNFTRALLAVLFISAIGPIIQASPARAAMTVLAQVSISNARIVSHAGRAYSVAFDLNDAGDTQTGVRYGVELVPIAGGSPDYSVIADQSAAADAISIAEGQTLPLSFGYSVPAALSGDYLMLAVATNQNGLALATAELGNVSVSAVNAVTLDPESCYLTIAKDLSASHYSLSQGVDVSPSEDLILHCAARNSYNLPLSMTPSVFTKDRSGFGDPVSALGSTDQILLGARETKNISISIPKPSAPQAYTSAVSLRADPDVLSNAVSVHWVLQGSSATIQDVSLDKSAYAAGDVAAVSFVWSGRADSFAGSRAGSSTDMSDVVAHVTLCGQAVDKPLSDAGGPETAHVVVLSDCFNPNVSVALSTATAQLDAISASIKSYIAPAAAAQPSAPRAAPDQSAPAAPGGVGDLAGYLIAGLCIFAIAVISGALKYLGKDKKGNKARLIILVGLGTAAAACYGLGAADRVSAYYSSSSYYQTAPIPNLPTHYVVLTNSSAGNPNGGGEDLHYALSSVEMPWYSSLVSSVSKQGWFGGFTVQSLLRDHDDQAYVAAASAANPASGSAVQLGSTGSTVDVGAFVASSSRLGVSSGSGSSKSSVVYSCDFNRFPVFATSSVANFYQAGGSVPIDIANAAAIDGATCSYTPAGASAPVSTSASLADDAVTIDLTPDQGSTTRAYVSSIASAADHFSIDPSFSGVITLGLSYKVVAADGTVLASYHAQQSVSSVEWDVTLIQGGTVSWQNPLNKNMESATVSINKTSFSPGEAVTFTATDPVTLACTNGATNFPQIDLYVLPVSQAGANKSYVTTFKSPSSNKPILNTSKAPLSPGNYYLLATYSDSFNFYHQYTKKYTLGTVRIPFTVGWSISAPTVQQAAPVCSADGHPGAALGWNSSQPGLDYDISRSSDQGSTYRLIKSVPTSTTSYIDYGDSHISMIADPSNSHRRISTTTYDYLAPLTKYFYTISTMDAFGNATSSVPFSVSMLDCSASTTATTTATSTPPNQPATTTPTGPGGNPGGPGGTSAGSCPSIFHATVCPNSDVSRTPTSGKDAVERTAADCQSTPAAPLQCEFYCQSPYVPKNGQCAQSDVREF